MSKISKTGEAMPTKLGAHAYLTNLYLYEFLSRFFLTQWIIATPLHRERKGLGILLV